MSDKYAFPRILTHLSADEALVLSAIQRDWGIGLQSQCAPQLAKALQLLGSRRRDARSKLQLTPGDTSPAPTPQLTVWLQTCVAEAEVALMLALLAWRDGAPHLLAGVVPAMIEMFEDSLDDPYREWGVYSGPPCLPLAARCCLLCGILVADAVQPGTRASVVPSDRPELAEPDFTLVWLLGGRDGRIDSRIGCVQVMHGIITGRGAQLGDISDRQERALASAALGMALEQTAFEADFGNGPMSSIAVERAVRAVPAASRSSVADRVENISRWAVHQVPGFPEALRYVADRVRNPSAA